MFYSLFAFPTKDERCSSTRLGRVRASLPQEYKLLKFIENVSNHHASWEAGTPACEWDGVTCNQEGKVMGIDWAARKLEGSLEWKHLPDTLLKLRMSSNKLSGSIALEDLPPHLEYLSLGSNNFTGSINLQAMPRTMKKLLLGNNELSGSVSFFNLPEDLSFLYLADNAGLWGDMARKKLCEKLKRSIYIDRTDLREINSK